MFDTRDFRDFSRIFGENKFDLQNAVFALFRLKKSFCEKVVPHLDFSLKMVALFSVTKVPIIEVRKSPVVRGLTT